MSESKALEVQQKKELVTKGEKTVPARYYVPTTDIVETADALLLTMEMPGVHRKDIDVKVTAEVDKKTYGFCCEKCMAKFKEHPEKFLKKKEDK